MILAAGLLAACCCCAARADAVSDLRSALARLQGQVPLRATVDIRDWRRTGEGKEAKERTGQASVGLEDGPRGLQPLYGRDLLARADAESRAAVKDKAASRPIELALAGLGISELRSMASAAPALSRDIDDAVFKSEAPDSWNGKPARRLVFEGSVDSLPDDDRKYVREFKSVLTVWIAPDGTPLASTRHFDLSGRAFVVISFEHHSDQQRTFALAGDHLVTLHVEDKGRSSGAGESQEFRTERNLQVQP